MELFVEINKYILPEIKEYKDSATDESSFLSKLEKSLPIDNIEEETYRKQLVLVLVRGSKTEVIYNHFHSILENYFRTDNVVFEYFFRNIHLHSSYTIDNLTRLYMDLLVSDEEAVHELIKNYLYQESSDDNKRAVKHALVLIFKHGGDKLTLNKILLDEVFSGDTTPHDELAAIWLKYSSQSKWTN